MIRIAATLCLLLSACSTTTAKTKERRRPAKPESDAKSPRIVAFLDGNPITWIEVSEKLIDLDLRRCVDLYLRWKILDTLKARHQVSNTPQELRRRADAFILHYQERNGEEKFRRQLKKSGFTKDSYRDFMASNRLFQEKLILEKLLRFTHMREGWIEIDRMVFVDASDARTFLEAAKKKGFQKAADEVAPNRGRITRRPRESFCRALPPRDLDAKTLDRLFSMARGEMTDVIQSATGFAFVFQVRKKTAPQKGTYRTLQDRIFNWIVEDPPAEQELVAWIGLKLKRSRIEYADRNSKGN